jgi:hypothetical protein
MSPPTQEAPVPRNLRPIHALVVAGVAITAACSPLATPELRTDSSTGQTQQAPSGSTRPGSTAKATPQVVPADRRWRPGTQQHGLQVYTHNANGKTADANIEKILDYVVARGANSVAFSFPLYTDGQHPKRVYTGEQTPSPAVMARIIKASHARGLRVMVRPLLDEENLRTDSGGWRGTIAPPNLDGWFRSYEQALEPYLEAATTAKAEEFVLATELTSLQSQRARWKGLAGRAGKVFPGTLSYTFNFDSKGPAVVPANGSLGLDLYFAVDLGPDATVDQLTKALSQHLLNKPKELRKVMVAQEVGIAAVDGAYRKPWLWGTPKSEGPNPAIQVNWFTAACRAVEQTGLQGLYFWMIDSSTDPTTISPATEGTAGFVGRPGEKAIERCFAGRP